MEITVTSTSWSVGDDMPSEEVAPQPITVATWPVYSDWVEAGRQIGATVDENVTLVVRVNIEKS